MPIRFICPSCSRTFQLRDELAGRRVKCRCGHGMQVPPAPTSSAPEQEQSDDAARRMRELFDEAFSAEDVPRPSRSLAVNHDTAAQGAGAIPRQVPPAVSPVRRATKGPSIEVKQPAAAADDRLTYPVHEYLDAALEKHREQAVQKLGPTSLPLLVGVFDFPWQLATLDCWIPMSRLLLIAGGMQAFLWTVGVQAGIRGMECEGRDVPH